MKNFFLYTKREDPQDAVVASHRLMLRAGLIEKLGSGLYHYLPLGLRVIKKIEAIVREEMDRAGALEFQLPILVPSELWESTGRWYTMGKEMFRLKDRHENNLVLGPTHEETFTDLLKKFIRSYRDLPINVYQIHTKFRDEIRPRFGVIRCREFIMKDAYSFHLDEDSLNQTYEEMRKVYRRIFARVGLETLPVEADTGAMGGSASEEFMVLSHIGEETLLVSEDFSYRSNQEKTPVIYPEITDEKLKFTEEEIEHLKKELKEIPTPNCKTIDDLAKFLRKSSQELLKTLLYRADLPEEKEVLVMILIRGDRQINEVKLKNHLKATEVYPAKEEDFYRIGSVPGYAGPWQLKSNDVILLFDRSVATQKSWITGANKEEYHIAHFHPVLIDKNWHEKLVDLALAVEGDPSPNGNGKLKQYKGIEVGHIFKLGDKYTKSMEFTVLDKNQKRIYPVMGCYGIGIDRTMATIIEQNHDEKGITWPISVAPFEIVLVDITKTEEEKEKVEKIYQTLRKENFDILWDNRDLRAGVKLTDSELIGFPIRITLGSNYFSEGKIEIYLRKENQKFFVDEKELIAKIRELRDYLYSQLPKA
ncbi:MAG: proline--tRNA ligase [Leptospiraceae bacterium]|nr:proline--tRNA ligase [Leptospiraceae bacterium]MDW7976695.1 proline--tRNA ligase [Leptospiraceae bacterium]